jgi:hypothetical protein
MLVSLVKKKNGRYIFILPEIASRLRNDRPAARLCCLKVSAKRLVRVG